MFVDRFTGISVDATDEEIAEARRADNDRRLQAVISVLEHYIGSRKLARSVACAVLDALDTL